MREQRPWRWLFLMDLPEVTGSQDNSLAGPGPSTQSNVAQMRAIIMAPSAGDASSWPSLDCGDWTSSACFITDSIRELSDCSGYLAGLGVCTSAVWAKGRGGTSEGCWLPLFLQHDAGASPVAPISLTTGPASSLPWPHSVALAPRCPRELHWTGCRFHAASNSVKRTATSYTLCLRFALCSVISSWCLTDHLPWSFPLLFLDSRAQKGSQRAWWVRCFGKVCTLIPSQSSLGTDGSIVHL